jgi:hypothetical protein
MIQRIHRRARVVSLSPVLGGEGRGEGQGRDRIRIKIKKRTRR